MFPRLVVNVILEQTDFQEILYERSKTVPRNTFVSLCTSFERLNKKDARNTTKLIDYVVDESFIFEIFQIEHVRSFEDLKVSLIARRQRQEGGEVEERRREFSRSWDKEERGICVPTALIPLI